MNNENLQEDTAKEILNRWLESEGWTTTVMWGRQRGIDIEAVKGNQRWVIEVKGCGVDTAAMRVNFLESFGQVLLCMDDSEARHSVAFPALPYYRNLWNELPPLAKERARIDAIFVGEDGKVEIA